MRFPRSCRRKHGLVSVGNGLPGAQHGGQSLTRGMRHLWPPRGAESLLVLASRWEHAGWLVGPLVEPTLITFQVYHLALSYIS